MANYALFRAILGCLLALDALALAHNHFRIFGPDSDEQSLLRTPSRSWALWALWLVAAIALTLNVAPLLSAAVLVGVFRIIYVHPRNRSLSAGLGALGFVANTLVTFVLQIELSRAFDCDAILGPELFFLLTVALSCIMVTSVVHKTFAGYHKDDGLEYALVNPQWSRVHFLLRKLSPGSRLFTVQNAVVLSTELGAGIFLLFHPTQPLGAMLLMATFLTANVLVRIGRLGLLMACAGLLYLPDLPWAPFAHPTPVVWHAPHAAVLTAVVLVYLMALRIVLGHLATLRSMYTPVRFPALVEKTLDRLNTWFPIGVWAVFTRGITDFFVEVSLVPTSPDALERPVFTPELAHPRNIISHRDYYRFASNEEAIIVLTTFIGFKYVRSADDLAQLNKRIARYAATLLPRHAWGQYQVKLTYMAIRKNATFEYIPALTVLVSLPTGAVKLAHLAPNYVALLTGAPA